MTFFYCQRTECQANMIPLCISNCNSFSVAGNGQASVLVVQYQFMSISIPSTISYLKPSKGQGSGHCSNIVQVLI